MKKSYISVFLASVILFSLNTYAHAEKDKKFINLIGVGVLSSSSVYKDIHKDPVPMPILRLKYKQFFISGKKIGYIIDEQDERRVDVFIEPRLMGYDSDEGHFLNGMEDRDYSLDTGIKIKHDIPNMPGFNASLSVKTDVLNESNGQEAGLGIGHTYKHRIFRIDSSMGLKWQSKDLVDHYYGVRASEVAAQRPEYSPDSAINYNANIKLVLGISQNWVLVMMANYELFGDEIKDSPIVENDHCVTGLFGIARMF